MNQDSDTFSSCATRGRRFHDAGIDAALTEGTRSTCAMFLHEAIATTPNKLMAALETLDG
jgi:hypothetical protein